MRTSNLSVQELENLIFAALDLGINFFDHADIYGRGKAESLFGDVIEKNQGLREKLIIQTKCGIKNGYYDNSKEHILYSVDESLKRLKANYLDVLLLHRPDALMEVEEIAEAFNTLKKQNLVRYFGVSNMNPSQISLLQKYIDEKLIINQIQLSIVHSVILDQFFNFNMANNKACDRDGGILEYSKANNIMLQAWSVLQASWEEGTFLNNPNYQKLNEELNKLAQKYNATPEAIAVSWILRIPTKIAAVVGTTKVNRLENIAKAEDIKLLREEWYALYKSVKGLLP